MIIEDQESFKCWLSAVLEPLCDADPVALAKYVFALVKKDKPPAELRAIMIEQLDVFLQHETKNFVELLFKTLETHAYSLPARSGVLSQIVPHDNSTSIQSHQSMQICAVQDSQPVVNHQVSSVQTNGIPAVSLQRREADSSSRPVQRKSDSDKEDKLRRRHRSSTSPPPSRGRSRSRSWERSRRSRSRGRERERDRSRPWRNKSPPPGSSGSSRGRRRTWSRSPPPLSGSTRSRGASRSRSRSPRYNHRSARNYRNRSPPLRSSISRSRSRSNDRSTRDKKEPLSGAATPTQDSNHGDVDMRLTTTSQSIQSVVSACNKPPVPGTTTVISDNSAPGPTFLPKRRCRDFDEKGYCMRGDLCPYDHGNDPVVLEDVALSQVLAFGPGTGTHTLPPPGTTPAAPEHVQPPAVTTMEAHPPPPPPHGLQPPSIVRPAHMEYNPDAPSMEPRVMWGRQQFRSGSLGMRGGMVRGAVNRSVAYNPQPQRELISVPVTDEVGQQHQQQPQQQQPQQQQQQAYQSAQYSKRNVTQVEQVNNQIRETPAKKKPGFDFNRLGPRHKNPNNCSLELKKVPRPLNNITHLNNHFSKFGKIVNIQVTYEGDPEAAIVTFSSHAEAYAAYRSTEAVLNNRFIKVFWHNSGANNEGKQENVPPPRPSVKDRLGVPIAPTVPTSPTAVKVLNTLQLKQEPVEKVIMSGNNLTKTVYIPTALKKANAGSIVSPVVIQENRVSAAAAIKKTQEMLAAKEILKKKQEEKRKEALKLTADLRKRKQDLLEKQIAEQKSLIERLEKGVTPEQREPLMTTIKKLQETIEQIRKDLNSAVVPAVKGTSTVSIGGMSKKTVQEAQREILDAELDLFTRQQEGGDTSELQRRVAELKMAAHSLGLLRPTLRTTRTTTALPHRAALSRGRGRGFAHVSVDHRPTKVLVSGYEEDEKDDVISHFGQFGEVVDYAVDESTPSLVLNYKSRKEAELAILKGRAFQDRLLSVTWCGGGQPATRSLRSGSLTGSLMSTVHMHPGGGAHRQVVLVGGAGSDVVVDEPLPEDEDEIGGAELNEDVLLQDDEEEEEDGEDRSWRR